MAQVSKYFKDFCYDNRYWQDKYRIHFPHLLSGDEPEDTNWQQMFAHRVSYDYRIINKNKSIFGKYFKSENTLPKESKVDHQKRIKLLIAFKEGDLSTLKQYKIDNRFTIDDLYIQDMNSVNVIQWAVKNNHKLILHYVFNHIVVPFYDVDNVEDLRTNYVIKKTNFSKRDNRQATILEWAVRCHQNDFLKQLSLNFNDSNNLIVLRLIEKLSVIRLKFLFLKEDAWSSHLYSYEKKHYFRLSRELAEEAVTYANVDFLKILKSDIEKSYGDNSSESFAQWKRMLFGGYVSYGDEDELLWLLLAFGHEHKSMMDFLIKEVPKNCEFTFSPDRRPYQHLNIINASKGNINTFKILLANNLNVHLVDSKKNNCLSKAAKNNHLMIARQVLALGINMEQTNIKGKTPIYLAAERGHAAVVDLLLDHGANPEQCDVQNKSMINAAAEHGYIDIAIKLLIHSSQCIAQGYRLNNIIIDDNVIESLSKKVEALLEKRMLAFAEQKFQTEAAKQSFITNFKQEKFDNIIKGTDQNNLLKVLLANQQDLASMRSAIFNNDIQANNKKSLNEHYQDDNAKLNFDHYFEKFYRDRNVALTMTLKGLKQTCLNYQRHLDSYSNDNDYFLENKRQNLQSLLVIINDNDLSNIDKIFKFSEKFTSYAKIFGLMRNNEEQGFINNIYKLSTSVAKSALFNMGLFKVKGEEFVEQIKEGLTHCPINLANN